jgi:hypothetical protein
MYIIVYNQATYDVHETGCVFLASHNNVFTIEHVIFK